MTNGHARRSDQLLQRREATCRMLVDADRITLELDGVYPNTLVRVAEEMENMMLCRYTIIEGGKLYLMQPDFGMFGSDDELLVIVSELFEEENYGIIYKD